MWCNVEVVSYLELVVVPVSGSCPDCCVSLKVKNISQHPCEFAAAPWGASAHILETMARCVRYCYNPHTIEKETETKTV